MPVFRPANPSRRVVGGFLRYLPGAGSIRTAAGVAAGTATVTGVGVAIKAAAGSTAGAASVSGVGVAIKAVVGASAGIAAGAAVGRGIKATTGVSAGVATVFGDKLINAITSTRIIQKPVDYVLAGDQRLRQGRVRRSLARRAFGE